MTLVIKASWTKKISKLIIGVSKSIYGTLQKLIISLSPTEALLISMGKPSVYLVTADKRLLKRCLVTELILDLGACDEN